MIRPPTKAVLVLAIVVAASVGAVAAPAVAPRPASAAQGVQAAPNIVLIIMDDMRVDDLSWMPTVVDQIAGLGMSYTDYYDPASLCCPARASILRGQYPHNTGILTNSQPDGGWVGSLNIDSSTIATWLDPTYATGYVGKYFNGYDGFDQTYVPPGWTDWMGAVRTYRYRDVWTNDNGTVVDQGGRNSPTVFGDNAVQFINERAPRRQPFFLHLSFVTPHNGGPHTDGDGGLPSPFVAPRDRGTYTGPPHPMDASYNEADISDKTGSPAGRPPLTPKHEANIALLNQQRRESLAAADRAVAGVMDALQAAGELDDTYIIFVSDNGFLLGEHRLQTKWQPYEPGSHLPLFIRGPDVPASREWQSITASQDIAPTILDMAAETGVGADITLDGQSLLPGQPRPPGSRNRAVLLERPAVPIDPENGGPVRHAASRDVEDLSWIYRGLVTRRWKLISWDTRGTYELYDLERDPYERLNVYDDPAYAARADAMMARLERLWLCAGAAC